MKLYDILNNEYYTLNEDEKKYIRKLYENPYCKKHFTSLNDIYILNFLVKYNINIDDVTEDYTFFEAMFEEEEKDKYKKDYTSIIDFENREILKNIYACDLFRDNDDIPTFHLYLKVIYSQYKSDYNINYIKYQIKHITFQ